MNSDSTNKSVNLEKIKLCKFNPRYTTSSNGLNTNMYDFLTELSYEEKEEDIIKDLLAFEYDLKKYLELLTSIKENGFNTQIDDVYCLEKDGYYIVAEGNRRISCLKILLNPELFPKEINEINFSNQNVESDEADYENYSDISDVNNERNKNFQKIKQIINSLSFDRNDEINIRILPKDSETIWNIIYSRSISGRQVGKREWSRSKYFKDLLLFFGENKNIDEETRKISEKKLNKKWSSIESDLKHAKWIFNIFKKELSNQTTESEEEIKNKIFKKMMKHQISGLQTNFSFSIFNEILENKDLLWIKKRFNLNKINKKRLNEILNFSFIGLEIKIDESLKIFLDNIMTFIWIWFEKKEITTRSKKTWKPEMWNQASKIVENDECLFTKDNIDEESVYKIIPQLSIEELKEQLEKHKNNKKISEIINEELKYREKEEFFQDFINKSDILSSFESNIKESIEELISQYKFNFGKSFLNAIVISLRSILECVFYGFWIKFNEFLKEKNFDIKNCCKNGNDFHKNIINVVKKLDILNEPVESIDESNALGYIFGYTVKLIVELKENKIDSSCSKIFKNFRNQNIILDKLIKNLCEIKMSDLNKIVNTAIHTLHLIKIKENWNAIIKKYINGYFMIIKKF